MILIGTTTVTRAKVSELLLEYLLRAHCEHCRANRDDCQERERLEHKPFANRHYDAGQGVIDERQRGKTKE